MSDKPSLHQVIAETVNSYLAASGGGIPNGFIYSVNYIDADGITNTEMGSMDDQSPVLSAGLLAYLQAVVDAWVDQEVFGCDHEDEDVD